MKYKVIAIDMDGTLLNSQNKVSDINRQVLFKALDKGISIILSTGRILRSALYYSKSIGLNSPVITCNGALISSGDGKDIIYENPMKIESIKKLVKLAEENNIYYHFYDADTFFTKKTNDGIFKYYESYENSLKKQQINLQLIQNPMELLSQQKPIIYKFIIIEDDIDKLLGFEEKLRDIKGINISSSWHNNIEVMNEGVSKGVGLEYLMETLNINKSEVVAIGDNENDIPMFKKAGLAIGMENGAQEIKKHVHVITDTNDEDGVAKAIEKYVLGN
ncbi:Cof-type HAD-IIB family hydrolase [Clostridium sp. Cult2]|uniref:Cof-type HAD-IIB family hydrolase n=1 Tax=Clostridium sp. Cult2 TaxID=2079003 RepID=UPI001F3F2D49|nr:Cof-type HAD-IIB family hydrolase [Clostridium sp. Cult2]MCF6466123.1 Cof-type HAD-IIB family hydrolase [Clostridium sp. Cult2]